MDNTDFFEGFDPLLIPRGRGGYRAGAGRPRDADRAPARPGETETPHQRYERARADKEEALARKAQVQADLDENLVVSRAAVQAGAAKAFALCSQSLDAIADNLERQLGVAPEVAEKVGQFINEAKSQLAEDLRRLGAIDGEETNDDLFA